jgi:acid phosphatase type 7
MRFHRFLAVFGLVALALAIPAPHGPSARAAASATSLASSAPQLVQSAGASETSAATTLTTTFPTATVGGNLLVLSASVYTGSTNQIKSVTDSAGNTWTKIGAFAVSGHYSDGEMWYSPNARSVTRVTVQTGSSAVVAMNVQEFSGVAAASALDVATGTSNTSTSPASGAVTPTAGSELAVGFIAGHGNGQQITITAPGYAAQPQQTSKASTVASVEAGYQVLGSASAQNFTGSFGASMYWAAGIAVFKSATAPPPPSNDFSMTASPSALSVTAGNAATSTIGTALTSGSAQNVTFSATGAPTGTTVAFSPASVTVGQSTTMTVTTSSSTPAGTPTLTVTGTGNSATHTVPVTLTVNVATTGDPVIAAAGDIACGPSDPNYNGGNGTATKCRQKYTSNLLVGAGLTNVLTLGDNLQSDDTLSGFQTAFDPTWGRVKSIMHPEVGNHEYGVSGAAGYYSYFGAGAGDPSKGYYSYNIGTWHIIEINSNCTKISGGCGTGSPEETWVKSDLAANPSACTLAVFHHPRYSSGYGGNNTSMAPIFQDLYDANADVVLSGHSHDYERFAPQDNAGNLDLARGITQFVVGTGGAFFTGFGTIQPNSQVHQNSTFGVLELTLHPTSYDWRFVPEAGKTWTDSGTRSCH